jgi:hypothetical protein
MSDGSGGGAVDGIRRVKDGMVFGRNEDGLTQLFVNWRHRKLAVLVSATTLVFLFDLGSMHIQPLDLTASSHKN